MRRILVQACLLLLIGLGAAGCRSTHEARIKADSFESIGLEERVQIDRAIASAARRTVVIRPSYDVVGTGCVVAPDGYVLTAEHVVRGHETVDVELADGRSCEGRVVAWSPRNDFAIVRVEERGLAHFALGQRPGLGQRVLAIGYGPPGEPTVSTGFVLYPRVRIPGEGSTYYFDSIWHMAPIFPGDSGGPLVDLDGRLVGINGGFASESASIAIAVEEMLRTLSAAGDGAERPTSFLGLAQEPGLRRAHGQGPPVRLPARAPRDFAESTEWTVRSVEETLVDVYGHGEPSTRRIAPEEVRRIISETRARFVAARRSDGRSDAALLRAMLAEMFSRIDEKKPAQGGGDAP